MEFGIEDLALMNIVSDRGSNFVAAFRDYQPLYCVGHRLNNIIKTSFFGNTTNKQISNVLITANNDSTIDYTTKSEPGVSSIDNEISTNESSTEEENDMPPSIPIKSKSRKNNVVLSNNTIQTARKMSIHEIPIEARSVLIALNQCKKLVKYIKKVSLIT